MEIHEILWRGLPITFELRRKNVKNINLNLKPDMTVMVSASPKVPMEAINAFVKSRGSWIKKNLAYFREAQPESLREKEYVSGESFKYLGKQIRLKVLESEEDSIKRVRGYLQIGVTDVTNYERKRILVNRWFHMRTVRVFSEVFRKMFPIVEKYGVLKPEIKIRVMRARWGSCLKTKGVILLNSDLIKAPKYCIEYVVLHELIHFLHDSHGSQFFSFLSALMPDWQERKRILDEEVIRSL